MKVGDRVRCIDARDCKLWYSNGAEGIITRIDHHVCVMFDTGDYAVMSFDGFKGWYGDADQFEVIE